MTTTRRQYLFQLMVVVTLTGIMLSIMSAVDAVDGGVGRKVFLVARMVFLIVLCTWFLRRSGETWSSVGLRRPRRWWVVPLAAFGGFVLLVLGTTVITNMLLPLIGASPPNVLVTPSAKVDLGEYLFWAYLVSWGTAAVGEELLARGFILDRFRKLLGSAGTGATSAAVLLQAAVFGSFHFYQGPGGVLVTAMAGVVLGVVWLVSGRNLWASILLHGAVNFLAANGL